MTAPCLDELETLTPPEDYPDDALCEVTAADLRALTALIPGARKLLERETGERALSAKVTEEHCVALPPSPDDSHDGSSKGEESGT